MGLATAEEEPEQAAFGTGGARDARHEECDDKHRHTVPDPFHLRSSTQRARNVE